MVKASAYGTDALRLSSFYSSCGIDIVGVSHLDEAINLRKNGITFPLFVIHAFENEAEEIVNHDLEVGLSDMGLFSSLVKQSAKEKKQVRVHLHVDTGMKRFGCLPEEALLLAKKIKDSKNLFLEGVMTHFVASETEKFDPFSNKQLKVFAKTVDELKNEHMSPRWIHTQNSGGALRFKVPSCNMVRVGVAPLGYLFPPLQPSLTVESTIIGINECKKNESVGYNKSYIAKRDKEKIAILPIGYHDGLHLNFSGKGYSLIHGKKAPFVGKICMDFMMVNITDIPEAKIGDRVLIFGKDEKGHSLPLETFASFAKTNIREVISTLGPRIERIFKGDTHE